MLPPSSLRFNGAKDEESGHSPVHGVQRLRLVVVSPLVMSHVNRDRRVEGGEEVVGGCRSRGGQSQRRLQKGRKISKVDSEAARISEQRQHFPGTYWLYQTGAAE